eukprot:GFUD01004987.1.p1 GENE.GFUD01004987.1~~GFUD01004987.1.p1  ORF type:complete len:182 (-),score=45.24 GFUD01004987.1:51-596(-)
MVTIILLSFTSTRDISLTMLSLARQSVSVNRTSLAVCVRSSLCSLSTSSVVQGVLSLPGDLPPRHNMLQLKHINQTTVSTRLSSTSQPAVLHSHSDMEFTITYPSHDPAYLKYRYVTPNSVNMYTTVVPSSLEGRGVAKVLANTAFDWAVENKLELDLSCWYLSGYLKRYPREDVIKLVRN